MGLHYVNIGYYHKHDREAINPVRLSVRSTFISRQSFAKSSWFGQIRNNLDSVIGIAHLRTQYICSRGGGVSVSGPMFLPVGGGGGEVSKGPSGSLSREGGSEERVVRILLECFLVLNFFKQNG